MPITAVAVGTGPSLKQYKPLLNVKHIGCGEASLVLPNLKLDAYCICDQTRLKNLPKDSNCEVYANVCMQNWWQDSWKRFPVDLPIGGRNGTAGGMCLSLACLAHDEVGLVGYDSLPNDPHNFDKEFANLIKYWQDRGKKLYSLMNESLFNTLLLKFESPKVVPVQENKDGQETNQKVNTDETTKAV